MVSEMVIDRENELNEFPQLPGVILGVAYQDAMGGVSVDIIDEDDEVDEVLEDYTDPELCAIVPLTSMNDIAKVKHAEKLFTALTDLVNEFHVSGKVTSAAEVFSKALLTLSIVNAEIKSTETEGE